jgi:hypothetical protein
MLIDQQPETYSGRCLDFAMRFSAERGRGANRANTALVSGFLIGTGSIGLMTGR